MTTPTTPNPLISERAKRGWMRRRASLDATRSRLGLAPHAPQHPARLFAEDVAALRAYGRTTALAVHQVLRAAQRLLWWTWDEELKVACPSRLPPSPVQVGKRGGHKLHRPSIGVPFVLSPPARRALARAERKDAKSKVQE